MDKDLKFVLAASAAIFTIMIFTSKELPDPYYHKEKVDVMEWVKREVLELICGEAE